MAGETVYIKTSEVQGPSFEVGAKVTYEGREMTVGTAPDSDGEMKMMDLSGFMALAACLPECGLTSLKCAAATPKCLLYCQRPLTPLNTHLRSHARSLSKNTLGPLGGAALVEGLKGNTTLQSLEYAARGSNRPSSVCFRVSAH